MRQEAAHAFDALKAAGVEDAANQHGATLGGVGEVRIAVDEGDHICR